MRRPRQSAIGGRRRCPSGLSDGLPPATVRAVTRRGRFRVGVTDHLGRHVARTGLERWLARAAPAAATGAVTIALVSDARMRALNRRFRGVDRVTDVLSFQMSEPRSRRARRPGPASAADSRSLGDIVIAAGRAMRQARDWGHPVRIELRVLALHGLLHLLGYNHGRGAARMASVERRCRRRGGLPAGLMERAGPAS